jgi:hypothetical protein
VWWLKLGISALQRQRHENGEFKVSLGHTVKTASKNPTTWKPSKCNVVSWI